MKATDGFFHSFPEKTVQVVPVKAAGSNYNAGSV